MSVASLPFSGAPQGPKSRSIRNHEYVTLKVYVSDHRQASNELKVLTHLETIGKSHPGSKLVRTARDAFTLCGETGIHQCLIHEPLAFTLSDLRELCGGKLPED